MLFPDSSDDSFALSRRQFVKAAAAGVGLALTDAAVGQQAHPTAASAPAEDLPIALIGAGSQGRNLIIACLKIPGVRFVAVCDIWPYHQKYAFNILKKFDQTVSLYADHRQMLEKEKDLAAVLIASPDWVHAEQTIDCLRAGRHVFCEKEMANTIEGCRQIALAARQTGKVVQIGHQRRSNPRYAHALKMIHKDRILGRITHVFGQWNRSRRLDLGWPKGEEMDPATLKQYGYESMEQFRNWRWYKRFSGGAMADLGSHQVDVFNWFLGCNPASVMASGGLDYYKDREWYDNVMAIYEYPAAEGLVRGFYQVLNTTSYGEYHEVFMGDEGSLLISEDPRRGLLFREPQAKLQKWENDAKRVESLGREAIELKIGETLDPQGRKTVEGQQLLAESRKPPHQLHLENFFNAVRAGKPDLVSCPPQLAFETAVSVLKANDAVEAGRRIDLAAADFKV